MARACGPFWCGGGLRSRLSRSVAGASVMFELGEVRDGQPQVLAVVGGPVLMRFQLIEALRSRTFQPMLSIAVI